ncbi:hypothetical protein M2322_004714 [Rhodoblastus acidophilus]|nr:hypothetical protein [Rhodoblastus acidophilus]
MTVASALNLRGFGGEFIAVDIGEFEAPDLKRLH